MDVTTIKKDLENQLGDINKELENIYLPHDAVLIFLGKRTAFEIAFELIDSLQQEQPELTQHEYIRKDALLEWAQEKLAKYVKLQNEKHQDPTHWGQRNAFQQIIDKLNSM